MSAMNTVLREVNKVVTNPEKAAALLGPLAPVVIGAVNTIAPVAIVGMVGVGAYLLLRGEKGEQDAAGAEVVKTAEEVSNK